MKKPLFQVGFGLALMLLYAHLIDAQWVNTNTKIGGKINALTVRDSTIFAGTDSGVFISSNNGTNWTAFNNGLPKQMVNSIIANDSGDIIAGTNDSGVFTCLKTGTSWAAVNTGLNNLRITSLAVKGARKFAGTGSEKPGPSKGGIFLSDDNDSIWTKADVAITGLVTTVTSFAVCGENIFAGILDLGLFVSTDNGSSWKMSNGITTAGWLRCISASGNHVFVGTPDGVYVSTDSGSNWNKITNGLQHSDIWSLFVIDKYLFAGTAGGVYFSANNGTNWVAFNTGLIDTIYSLTVSQNHLFAGTRNGYVWRRPISETPILKPPVVLSEQLNFNIHYSYNKIIDITFYLPHPDQVEIALFNLYGQKVATLVDACLSSGFHALSWNSGNSSSGFYTLCLQAGTNKIIKNILLSR